VRPGGKPTTSSTQTQEKSSSTSNKSKSTQPAPQPKSQTVSSSKPGEIDLFGLDDLMIDEPSPPKQQQPIKSSTKTSTKSKSTASEWDQFE